MHQNVREVSKRHRQDIYDFKSQANNISCKILGTQNSNYKESYILEYDAI